jgi:hypothetical protein
MPIGCKINRMSTTREQLYAEVWAEPMTTVAARYEVSSNYLARVCRHLNVPFPHRGYWAKVQHGQTPTRPPLPAPRVGDVLQWEKGDSIPRSSEVDAAPHSVNKKASTTHQIVTSSTRESFEKGRLSEEGYLRPYKRNLVDVFVTRRTLPQALETATDLFRRFDRSGRRVTLATSYMHRPPLRLFEAQTFDYHHPEPWAPNHATVVYFGSMAFGLTIFETTEHVEVVYDWDQPIRYVRATPDIMKSKSRWTTTSKHHMPSGRLALRAYFPDWRVPWEKVWVASRAGRLPFTTIVQDIEAESPRLMKLREQVDAQAELARQRREAEERERQRQERERHRAEAQEQSREQLLEIVEGWSLARSIEAFFDDALRRSKDLDLEHLASIEDRLAKAREMLGGLDALARFRNWKTPEELLALQRSV